jgi:hypothetical protein
LFECYGQVSLLQLLNSCSKTLSLCHVVYGSNAPGQSSRVSLMSGYAIPAGPSR